MKTKEELEDEIKKVSRKRDEAYLEMSNQQKILEDLMDDYFKVSKTHHQVQCINCGGVGYGKTQGSDKNVVCELCKGKGYNWLPRYQKKSDSN